MPSRRSAPGVIRHRPGRSIAVGVAALSFGLAGFLAIRNVARGDALDVADAGGTLVAIWIALLAGIVAILAAAWGAPGGGLPTWRRLSVAYAIACVLALVGIWSVTVRSDPDQPGYGTAVLDEGQVDAALETIAGTGNGEATIRIPTGVSIQSIEFLSANNVVVTGHIWQKYPDDLPDDFVRGVDLPQAIFEEDPRTTEAYRERGPGYELVGWHLRATLRQGFDYRLYPFDHQDVRLQLRSADRRAGIVLTPDFASYPAWSPSALPGVEPNFVGDGWRLRHSVFSYAASPATTTFGRSDGLSAVRPDLYFNVGLQRRSFDVLVNRLILLSVSLLILLGIVLATERTPQGVNRYDLSVARTLGLGAALLFVLVLDYGQFRSMLRPEGLTYLGYAYLVIVLGLSLAILNGVLYASGKHRFRLVEYEDNAIPNLLFAPILLSVYLVITIILFYVA